MIRTANTVVENSAVCYFSRLACGEKSNLATVANGFILHGFRHRSFVLRKKLVEANVLKPLQRNRRENLY